jgi:hypothetical protein
MARCFPSRSKPAESSPSVLVGENKSVALMIGYLSAYWFAVDEI